MQALRMELNPHFLFNALNAISGLVRRKQNDVAVGMLAQLGDLLRATLDRDLPPEISLEDELALLDRFLSIERTRFGDRLTVQVLADDASRKALVPTLLLQPLVENAIKHGVARVSGPALVQVHATTDDDVLTIHIRNTAGTELQIVDTQGIGLSNTRARLMERYGGDAELHIATDGSRLVVVTVTLPYKPQESEIYVQLT
jgi:two-component system, LytTR family, sensor kinase